MIKSQRDVLVLFTGWFRSFYLCHLYGAYGQWVFQLFFREKSELKIQRTKKLIFVSNFNFAILTFGTENRFGQGAVPNKGWIHFQLEIIFVFQDILIFTGSQNFYNIYSQRTMLKNSKSYDCLPMYTCLRIFFMNFDFDKSQH